MRLSCYWSKCYNVVIVCLLIIWQGEKNVAVGDTEQLYFTVLYFFGEQMSKGHIEKKEQDVQG